MADTKSARVVHQSFGLLQFKRNQWFYELSEAQQPEDLLRPEFWADVAGHVRGHEGVRGVGDIILLDKPDTGWSAFARVDAIGPAYLKIRYFMEAKPVAVEIAEDSPLTTRWNVGKRCHDVIRASSKDVVSSGFQTKADAAAWIANHLKDMAA